MASMIDVCDSRHYANKVQSIYALGSNGSGQLGIGHDEDVSTPHLINIDMGAGRVKRIVAGGNHTLLLLEDGRVFASGSNEDGRCGLEESISQHTMMPIISDTTRHHIEADDVAASWSASYILLRNDGDVMVCGIGEHGELGLGPACTTSLKLQKIKLPRTISKVIGIRASVSHAVVLCESGEVWGWGRGRKGQLGLPYEDAWSPRKVLESHFMIREIACGTDFTFCLGGAFGGKPTLRGCEGRDRFRVKTDLPLVLIGWSSVAASWSSIYVMMRDGRLKAWGRNDRGQVPASDLPSIRCFAAGSEHWLAISDEDQVLTAGWTEHGNCGSMGDASGVVSDTWILLPVDGRPVSVFAGCATSFIVVER